MSTALPSGRPRLATLALALTFAVVLGGADGCSSDPNVTGARLYIEQNNLSDAVAALDRALEANPDNVTALALRADVRRRQADAATDPAERQSLIDQMAADIARAYQLDPTDADVLRIRQNSFAMALTKGDQARRNQSADPAVARALFETAIRLMPDSSQGHFGLGLTYLGGNDAPGAIPHLRRTIEIDPSNTTAHIYLGRSLLLTEQGTEGVAVLEAAAARFPDDEEVQAQLLNAYAAVGRTDEALERYEVAVQRTPDDPQILYNYGLLLLRAERFDDAIAQFERATALAPTNGDAQFSLGAALQNQALAFAEQANETTDTAAADALIARRDEYLNRSLTALLRAREIAGGASDANAERSACNALFQVYTQLSRLDDARAVAACAGIDMN